MRTKDGRWYLNRVIPYRTLDNVIDGVVVTFTDISEQKITESILAARNLAEGIVETVGDPLVALDGRLRVVAANTAFYRLFQTVADATVGQSFYDLGNGQWNIPRLRELLEKILPQNSKVDNFIVENKFPQIGLKKMTITALRIHREGIGTETILLTIKDIMGSDRGAQ